MEKGFHFILLFAGLLVFLDGWVTQRHALSHHRAPDSPGPWMSWNPKHWREQRGWFSSEYGYRLYRWAGWKTLLGGLIMTAAWLL